MKQVTFSILLIFLTGNLFSQNGPGSGNCLDFDGNNDYVEIGDVLIDGLTNITVEAWINPRSLRANGGPSGHNANEGAIVHKNGSSDDNLGLTVTTAGIAFYIDNGSNNTLIGSAPATNQWTHIAATYDGSDMQIYINGILDNSMSVAGSGALINNTNSLRIGGGHIVSHEFDGKIDEVRIWSSVRNQNQIRNRMCRKFSGTPGPLQAYYRVDGSTGTTLVDATGSNDGTLNNMTNADWVDSGAPIGDLVARSYPGGGWTGATTLTLVSPAGEDEFSVSTMTGTPTGVHIYGVTEVPNVICGATGLGSNDRYFGVFIVNGTAPTYTVNYDYSNNPYVNGFNEANLDMVQRTDNSATTCVSWSALNATLNMPGDFLEETDLSGRNEIIITSETTPLPIELISFEANANEDKVDLSWVTAAEIQNDFFTVERSVDGKNWEEVVRANGKGNSSEVNNYFETDYEPLTGVSYYRLKQTDFNGDYTYSTVIPVKFDNSSSGNGIINLFPSPASVGEFVNIEFDNIFESEMLVVLRDINGREFYSKVIVEIEDGKLVAVPIEKHIPAGVYLVTATSENQMYSQKLIIK